MAGASLCGVAEDDLWRLSRLILEGLETRTAPTANIFGNVADEVSLRKDIAAADSNDFADNLIELMGSITLSDTTAGQLVIANATSTPKTWCRKRTCAPTGRSTASTGGTAAPGC